MATENHLKSDYYLTRWLFLRALGSIYLVAFYSVGRQVIGLFGEQGILPANNFLELISTHFGSAGVWLFPSIFWTNASNTMLAGVCLLGCILSILVILGIGTGFSLFVLWALYLSLVNVGQEFLSFQWDALLLEVGFLAIFFAPWQFLECPWKINWRFIHWKKPAPPSIVMLWLFRWLVFRFMFQSGYVKLASGDPNWRNLTALNYHYLTQPLPTPIAWYAAKLPHWFNQSCTATLFVVELLVPFLIFAGRKARLIACLILVIFQMLIALTGNYAYFNLLTITLCICLLDDQIIKRIFPWLSEKITGIADNMPEQEPDVLTAQEKKSGRVKLTVPIAVAALIVFLNIGNVLRSEGILSAAPSFIQTIFNLPTNYFITSNYGLFAVMTTQRLEIQIEGSNDGQTWREYGFKYKPGNLAVAPYIVAPLQPRLDWQMWFAALSDAQNNPWFINFVFRLLQGGKEVLALLADNPFPVYPPKYIRAELYDYHFTRAREKEKTKNWWKRDWVGEYLAPVSLRAGSF